MILPMAPPYRHLFPRPPSAHQPSPTPTSNPSPVTSPLTPRTGAKPTEGKGNPWSTLAPDYPPPTPSYFPFSENLASNPSSTISLLGNESLHLASSLHLS